MESSIITSQSVIISDASAIIDEGQCNNAAQAQNEEHNDTMAKY
jgi:hypothetical protein